MRLCPVFADPVTYGVRAYLTWSQSTLYTVLTIQNNVRLQRYYGLQRCRIQCDFKFRT